MDLKKREILKQTIKQMITGEHYPCLIFILLFTTKKINCKQTIMWVYLYTENTDIHLITGNFSVKDMNQGREKGLIS